MIPARLLEHTTAPPAVDLPDVTGPLAKVLPLPLWPDGYTEGPCAAEMDVVCLHRDGLCVVCHACDRSRP